MKEFENNYIKIYFDNIENIVCLRWKSLAPKEKYRESILPLIEIVKYYKSEKLLCDLINYAPISDADEIWTGINITKQLKENNVNKIALLLPSSVLGERSLSDMVDNAELDGSRAQEINYFSNIEHAYEWLKS